MDMFFYFAVIEILLPNDRLSLLRNGICQRRRGKRKPKKVFPYLSYTFLQRILLDSQDADLRHLDEINLIIYGLSSIRFNKILYSHLLYYPVYSLSPIQYLPNLSISFFRVEPKLI